MTSRVTNSSVSSSFSTKVKSGGPATNTRSRILSQVENTQRHNSISIDNAITAKEKQRHPSEATKKSVNSTRSRSRSRIPRAGGNKPVPNRRKSLEGLLSPGGRKTRPTPSPRLDLSLEGVFSENEDKENRPNDDDAKGKGVKDSKQVKVNTKHVKDVKARDVKDTKKDVKGICTEDSKTVKENKDENTKAEAVKATKDEAVQAVKAVCSSSHLPVPARRLSLGDILDSPVKEKRPFEIVEPARPSLPPGVINIDIEHGLYEYAGDVIVYLMEKEKEFVISQNFLEGGSTSPAMRSMLVDWLIQVQHHLRLCQETLYLAILMLDTVLSKREINNEKLQLVGVTCLLLASKLEEYYPADIGKLVHLTSNSYTAKQVLRMELVVLEVLGCQLYMPEIMSFLRRFIRASFRGEDTKFLKTCQYLIDATIPEIGFSTIVPSVQAAASVLASNLLYFCNANQETLPLEKDVWTATLAFYTRLDIMDIVYTARAMIRCQLEMKWEGAMQKYKSHSAHERVALSLHLRQSILQAADKWLTNIIET